MQYMERSFFYIWFLYRKLIFKIYKRVDHSNGLTFATSFFVLLPLPVITILILVFKRNRHSLSKIYVGYSIICLSYCIFLAFIKKDKREEYFEEFEKIYNVTSHFKKMLIWTSLFYPVLYVIFLVILERYFH